MQKIESAAFHVQLKEWDNVSWWFGDNYTL